MAELNKQMTELSHNSTAQKQGFEAMKQKHKLELGTLQQDAAQKIQDAETKALSQQLE